MDEQNRNPDGNAYAYDVASDRWSRIAPLGRPRGAAAAVALNGRIHLIGGASAPTLERASVGWHEAYDPASDTWMPRSSVCSVTTVGRRAMTAAILPQRLASHSVQCTRS